MSRIGIYSGSFDPIHKGHIAFALQAIKVAKLDSVVFAPEIKPRRRTSVSHIAHRLAMLQLSLRPYKKLAILELKDSNFSPRKTMPKIKQKFATDQLVLLLGSDLLEHMHAWPAVEVMLRDIELVVAIRHPHTEKNVADFLARLPVQPLKTTTFMSKEPQLSASIIRHYVRDNIPSSDILPSIAPYIAKHWLYHDIRNVDIDSSTR